MIPFRSSAVTQPQLLGWEALGTISGGTLPMLNERARRQFESSQADNPVNIASRRRLVDLLDLVGSADPSRGWKLPPF